MSAIAHRRDFPMSKGVPVACVRYTFLDLVLRVTAGGVHLNEELLSREDVRRLAELLAIAASQSDSLSAGQPPGAAGRSWVDESGARR